ncbi:hypothetical protein PVAP13_8KG143401 [Panicum virgatum]|uniref:Uncharacterized protein n=1 Tax=Panicum virgatum TaxID=38727 RepID=A0A8T0PKX2_PANVG|nr:hypothetical protein PVAP13_8KG143401 [Panicum virgatum]
MMIMKQTSPMRPIACESDDIILMAPMSCNMSSAAIVSARILDSANATSSGMFLSSISRCSSTVFEVNGRVGFVEEGSTFYTPHTLMISGA